MRYLPQTIVTIPNAETPDTRYYSPLDPQGDGAASYARTKMKSFTIFKEALQRYSLFDRNSRVVAAKEDLESQRVQLPHS